MAAFAIAATISGITNWAIVTWETFHVFFSTYLLGDPECRLGKIWRSLIFFIFYQARVDLLQTSCGPGLGQVWAWLPILLWNWLSINDNRLSIINSSLESSVSQTSLHSAKATMVPGGKSISLSKKSTAWRTSGCKDPPPCTWHLKLGGRKQDDKSA